MMWRTFQGAVLVALLAFSAGGLRAAGVFEDQPTIAEAVNAALEYQKTGATVPWQSAKTGNAGTITVLRTFFRGGTPCREYRRTLEQGGAVKESVDGIGCRANTGVWILEEGNRPVSGSQQAARAQSESNAQPALTPVTLPPIRAQRVHAGGTFYINVWAYRTPPGRSRGDLFIREDVFSQEILETYPKDGALHVDLLDGGKLRLGANSQVRLDEFVFNPSSGTGKVTASIGRGVARFITGKVKGDNFQVRSPTALIGARGTDFVVGVAPSGATVVSVISGSVEVTPLGGAPPQLLNAGQTLGVNPGGTSTTTAVSRPFDPGLEEASGPSFNRRSSAPGFGSRSGAGRSSAAPSGGPRGYKGHSD